MRVRYLSTAVAAAVLSLSLAACGTTDSPAAPRQAVSAPTAPASHLLLSSPQSVTPLLRTTPLASSITVSKTIGILGGTLSIPQAGVTIVVPALAVTSPTNFSVTAPAGSNVAYQFEPHGIRFTTPLVMTQDLRYTQARSGGLVNALNLYGGYFPDSSQPTLVTELLNVNVNLLSQVGVMTLWHFSGYIVAVGNEDDF